jgi:hypothetical protein
VATKQSVKVLRGRVMRVTRLDSCGNPALGPQSTVVSKGVVEIKVTPEVETGDEIKVKAFDGSLCISDKYCDQVKWWNTEITMCQVDPDMVSLMNPTWQPVLGYDGSNIGWMDNTQYSCDVGFALEVWMQAQSTVNACSEPTYTGITGNWWYYCLPWVIGGTPGDIDLKNDAVSFVYNGRTLPNSQWGVGPYPVLLQTVGTGGSTPTSPVCAPLPVPVPATTQVVQFLTTMAPPTPVIGAQDTVAQPGVTAAVVVTGAPGAPTLHVTVTIANAQTPTATIDPGDGTGPQTVPLTGSGGSSDPAGCTNPMGQLPLYAGTWTYTYGCPGIYTVVAVAGAQSIPTPTRVGGLLTASNTWGTPSSSSVTAYLLLDNLKDATATINWGDGSALQTVNLPSGTCGVVGGTSTSPGAYPITHAYALPWTGSPSGGPTITVSSQDPTVSVTTTIP